MKPTILAVVIGMTVSTNVLANEEFRSHEAHVHGKVEVNIAQDGQELLVEVTAPGADVVGFEHAPETAEQKKVFEQAIAQLNKPEELFGFNNAGCTLKFKSVTNTLEGDHDDHKGHDHAEHDHDDHDDHKGHDHAEHDHDDHEGHDHSEGGHGEFTVEYHYQCSNIEKLDTVNTQWFSKFGNTKSMTVNLLTDSAQIQEILNAERISFQF
ncbi:zinc uptake protein ZrgA [Vibrio lentus]|uniref:zinc uptake protein ZrgA n=1 Tax=Vibrio lentus TaxID=136468 RepID=UPI003D116944